MEKEIQNQILKTLGKMQHVRMFRNNVGNAWMGKEERLGTSAIILDRPRRVQFGLCKGSSDLIGWQEVIITEEMVGTKFAAFTAIEVKGQGSTTIEQQRFVEAVNNAGGLAGIVRSIEDAKKLIIY